MSESGFRNQPHVYAELSRYGLHTNLKTSVGTAACEKSYFRSSDGKFHEIPFEKNCAIIEGISEKCFTIDGLTSRELMPYPYEPFREPVLWAKYDDLSAKDRVDQVEAPQFEKEVWEALVSSIGDAPASKIGFVEALRWYTLAGHSMCKAIELAGTYKLGKGGMTSLARAMLDEYKGDLLFSTVIREMKQEDKGVTLMTKDGRSLAAKYAICTIPL
jgi:hypothetical protein